MKSEWDVIKSIRSRVGERPASGDSIRGIGDDCAVYTISEGRCGLFSTDISVEDVHFDLRYTSYHDAGYRSMSANISDIYAMGGNPVLALIALAVPQHTTQDEIDRLYEGLAASASKNNTFIAGGDLSRSDKLVISISIYGETANPVYRSGATPGDYIYVTGKPGLSKLGLDLLRQGDDCTTYPDAKRKHLTPDAQNELLDPILSLFSPTAMIDISDGLLSDLGHICEESGTGFILDTASLPVHDEIKKFCKGDTSQIHDYILRSGEEYELLFTSGILSDEKEGITCIGTITGSGYALRRGDILEPVEIKGYDHFK